MYTVDPAVCSHTRQRITEEVREAHPVDEVPQEFHRERKAAAERMLEATELALPIVQAITENDATADLNPEAVGSS